MLVIEREAGEGFVFTLPDGREIIVKVKHIRVSGSRVRLVVDLPQGIGRRFVGAEEIDKLLTCGTPSA